MASSPSGFVAGRCSLLGLVTWLRALDGSVGMVWLRTCLHRWCRENRRWSSSWPTDEELRLGVDSGSGSMGFLAIACYKLLVYGW